MPVSKLKRGPSAPVAFCRDPFLPRGAEEQDGTGGPANMAPTLQFGL